VLAHLLGLLVALSVLLSLLDHRVDLVLAKPPRRLDSNRLLLVSRLVLGRHVNDAVCVNVKGNLDLGDAAGRRRDPDKVKLAEELVVGSHVALSLQNLDTNLGLVVRGGRELLRLLVGDCGVPEIDYICEGEGRVKVPPRVSIPLRGIEVLGVRISPGDEAGEDTAQGLDTEGKGGHVEEQDVLYISLENTPLDGSTHGDNLVRVHPLGGVTLEQLLDHLDNAGHTGHASDEENLQGCEN